MTEAPDNTHKMSNAFNGLFGSSSLQSTTPETDDHDDDGSKEHTSLLSKSRHSQNADSGDEQEIDIGSSQGAGAASQVMTDSIYTSPKEPRLQRRRASTLEQSSKGLFIRIDRFDRSDQGHG